MVNRIRSRKFLKRVVELSERGLNYREIGEELKTTKSMVNQAKTAHNSGFKTIKDYENDLARKRGFMSFSQYQKFRREIKRDLLDANFPETVSLERLDEMQSREGHERLETEEELSVLNQIVDELPEIKREIIIRRYWHNQTLDEIGLAMNYDNSRVNQIERVTLDEIREIYLHEMGLKTNGDKPPISKEIKYSKRNIGPHIEIEDGELLLFHILRKKEKYWPTKKFENEKERLEEIRRKINALWYGGEELRKASTVARMNSNHGLVERRLKIANKYIPFETKKENLVA